MQNAVYVTEKSKINEMLFSRSKIISTRRPGFYPLPDSVNATTTVAPVVATSTVTMPTSEVSPSGGAESNAAKKKKKPKKKKSEGADGLQPNADPNAQGK